MSIRVVRNDIPLYSNTKFHDHRYDGHDIVDIIFGLIRTEGIFSRKAHKTRPRGSHKSI